MDITRISVHIITNFKIKKHENSHLECQGADKWLFLCLDAEEIDEFAQNRIPICMKNILKNAKNVGKCEKQPIAQMKKNMLAFVKCVQKRKRNISKLYIDTVRLSCYTRTIEQPIAQNAVQK